MNRLAMSPRGFASSFSTVPRSLSTVPRSYSTVPRSYSTVTKQSTQTDRPLRLAVIGAGPAGFYTAYRVLTKLTNAHVDMYESLPVPYGLVRYGVAPDHPEVKVCCPPATASSQAIDTEAQP